MCQSSRRLCAAQVADLDSVCAAPRCGVENGLPLILLCGWWFGQDCRVQLGIEGYYLAALSMLAAAEFWCG